MQGFQNRLNKMHSVLIKVNKHLKQNISILEYKMYVFVGTSDYLPSADKWLLYIYCIILANTLRERYKERSGSMVECLT